jgi:hypothetical protein
MYRNARCAAIGHHHHIAGAHLVRYAQEAAWREDHRRVDNGRQILRRDQLAPLVRAAFRGPVHWVTRDNVDFRRRL